MLGAIWERDNLRENPVQTVKGIPLSWSCLQLTDFCQDAFELVCFVCALFLLFTVVCLPGAAGCVFMCCPLVFSLLHLIKWSPTTIMGFMFCIGPIIPVPLVYPQYFDDSESKNMNFTNLDTIIGGN